MMNCGSKLNEHHCEDLLRIVLSAVSANKKTLMPNAPSTAIAWNVLVGQTATSRLTESWVGLSLTLPKEYDTMARKCQYYEVNIFRGWFNAAQVN